MKLLDQFWKRDSLEVFIVGNDESESNIHDKR